MLMTTTTNHPAFTFCPACGAFNNNGRCNCTVRHTPTTPVDLDQIVLVLPARKGGRA